MYPQVKDFEYGDLSMKCSCGAEYVIADAIRGGVSLVLRTTHDSQWTLSCDKCKTSMSLFFKESSEEKIALVKEQEKKESENESIQQGNNEEINDPGIPGDVELSTETNS